MVLDVLIPLFALGMIVFGWMVGRFDGGVTSAAAQKKGAAQGRG